MSVTYELFLCPARLGKHVLVHHPRYDQDEVGGRYDCNISQKEIFEAMLGENLTDVVMISSEG
jgi:hypothetical protein